MYFIYILYMYFLSEINDKKNNITIVNKNKINNDDFTNNDFIILDFDNNNKSIDINNIHKQTEFVTVFNYRNYIDNILKTYDYNFFNISKQFKKDFHRCKLAINNVQFNNINMFINNNQDITIETICIMLFNQSTFGWPMEKIINFHSISNNLLLTDFRESYIHINVCLDSDNTKKIYIYKRLKIIELIYEDDVFIDKLDKYYVDINLNFNFDDINKFIQLKNIKKYIEEFNIMTWNIVPIKKNEI